MKRLGILVAVTLSLLVLAAAVSAQTARPISDFGAGGAAVPAHVYDLLPEGFFTLSMAGALASGESFVASFEPYGAGARLDRLALVNTGDRLVDLVISATGPDGATQGNYLVRLGAGENRTIDLAALGTPNRLDLLALQPFSARLTNVLRGGHEAVERLDVLPPAARIADWAAGGPVPAKASCGSASRIVQVCNTASQCVTAKAIRRIRPSIDPFDLDADLRVQYPVGTPFHCPNGTSSVDESSCEAPGYGTKRCGNASIKHDWSGIDATINDCVPSSAQCVAGCTGSWTVTC